MGAMSEENDATARVPGPDERRLAGPAQVPAHDERRLAGPAQVPAHEQEATAHLPADEPPADTDDHVPPPPPGAPPTAPPPPPPGGAGFPSGGAGFPPPGGFPPPPPGTSGWATRYGLVRPARGRVLAGVCAAIARATNTDPVLWRVLFAVLTLAGGVSVVVYLIAWLLIPAEGDTGSPLEALLGRGRSSTSPILVVIVGIIAALSIGSVLSGHGTAWFVVAALVVGAIMLANRGRSRTPVPPPPAGEAPTPFGAVPPPAFAAPADPAMGAGTDPGTGYRPPFAPHGPYVSSPYPYPGLGAPPPPPLVKPRREPSRLGRLTLSVAVLGIGLLALIDVLVHGRVPFPAYVAIALASVGAGLLIGAWFGRARWLIALGAVLALVLAGSSAAGDLGSWRGSAGDITWAPASMAELSDSYKHGVGNADLDLTQLSFDKLDKHVSVTINAGNLHVIVPPKVDVVVHAKVNVGDANVFNTRWDGVNNPERTITDNDTDGTGPGHLTLDLRLGVGDLEVSR